MSKVDLSEYGDFIIDRNSAPSSWFILTHLKYEYFAEVLTRIRNKVNIYSGYSEVECSRIKEIIIPALIKDGIIKETQESFELLKKIIIVGNNDDRLTNINIFPKMVKSITNKINEDNLDNCNIFYFILRNVLEKEYDEINAELDKIKKKIIKLEELPNPNDEECVDCEFAFINFKKPI